MDDAYRPAVDQPTPGECTTTRSFDDHGIDDGSTLIQRTYYRLAAETSSTFEPTAEWFDRIEAAFVWAYLATVEGSDVPRHVEAAIDDARALTAESFADRADADLRTDVLPSFYRHVAGFHCAYRD